MAALDVFVDQTSGEPLRFYLPRALPQSVLIGECIERGGGEVVASFPTGPSAGQSIICVAPKGTQLGKNVELAVQVSTIFDCATQGKMLKKSACQASVNFPPHPLQENWTKKDNEEEKTLKLTPIKPLLNAVQNLPIDPEDICPFSSKQDAFILQEYAAMHKCNGISKRQTFVAIANKMNSQNSIEKTEQTFYTAEMVKNRFQAIQRQNASISLSPVVEICSAPPKPQKTSPIPKQPKSTIKCDFGYPQPKKVSNLIESWVLTLQIPNEIVYYALHIHNGDILAAFAYLTDDDPIFPAWELIEDEEILMNDAAPTQVLPDDEDEMLCHQPQNTTQRSFNKILQKNFRSRREIEERKTFLLQYKTAVESLPVS